MVRPNSKKSFPVQKPPPSFRGGFQLFGNSELLNSLLHLTH
nr:MAG TPA: Pigment-dispersing hormone (PDH) [Caudoviricetes sp.]